MFGKNLYLNVKMAVSEGKTGIDPKVAKIRHFRVFSAKSHPFSPNVLVLGAENDPVFGTQNPNKNALVRKVVHYFTKF